MRELTNRELELVSGGGGACETAGAATFGGSVAAGGISGMQRGVIGGAKGMAGGALVGAIGGAMTYGACSLMNRS